MMEALSRTFEIVMRMLISVSGETRVSGKRGRRRGFAILKHSVAPSNCDSVAVLLDHKSTSVHHRIDYSSDGTLCTSMLAFYYLVGVDRSLDDHSMDMVLCYLPLSFTTVD